MLMCSRCIVCAYSCSIHSQDCNGPPAELGEAAGLFTTEAIVTGVVLSLGAAGGWGLGVVGPNAPGLPEEGHYLARLRERRCVAAGCEALLDQGSCHAGACQGTRRQVQACGRLLSASA